MSHRAVSIAFQTDKPLTAYGALAARSEAFGFDAVTVYNDLLYQPAWLPLYVMAQNTWRVRLGPAAVSPFTCHPINIAGNIALIDQASHGRAYLGLARGSWLEFLGIEPKRTPVALSEAFRCICHLLARSKEPLPGQVYSLAGGDSLRWNVLRSEIPMLLGSWGEQTIRACIHHVGEVKLGGTANPRAVERLRSVVTRAAAQAGREPDAVGLVVGAVTVVDEDGECARTLAKRQAALYLPVIAKLDPTLALEPDRLERINAAAAEYDFESAAKLISDDLLKQLALAGTPDQVAEQAEAMFRAGATRVEFGTPHGESEEEGLRLLGERVLPQLKGIHR